MAFYRQVGEIPPKRHTQHRRPDGGLYSEELVGEEGFSSDSALLYHRGVPSAIVDARPWELPDQSLTPNAPLVPRHLKLHDLFPGEEHKAVDAVTGRRLVLGNGDVRISYAVSSLPSPYYRNATGDECVYVERGAATVETVFGARSEEHTSELQSRQYLVCRLLLEKKNNTSPLIAGCRGAVLEQGGRNRHNAERHPQEVPRARYLHLPPHALHEDHNRHLRVLRHIA